MTGVLKRETDTQGEGHVTTEAEIGVMHDGHHQRLEEAGRTLPWSLQREQSPVTP